MPRDALYEESAQPLNAAKQAKWYLAFHILGILFAVATGIQTLVCITFLPSMVASLETGLSRAILLLMWIGLDVGFALVSFIFFRLRRRFNVSFDYLFVQDELRITKVFNGKKRKPLVTLQADHVLQLGYCEGDAFERTYAGLKGAKPVVMTPNRTPAEDKDFIHILYSTSMGKTLYILECRKEMLEHLIPVVGRNKFVRE